MNNWLERLRKKSKSVKDQYAFFGALGITSIIAFFWVTSFSAPAPKIVNETDSTFGETKSAFGHFFNRAKDQLGSVLTTSKDEQATTTEMATTTEIRQNVIIPNLASSTLPRPGIPIMIGTTTASNTPDN